MARAYIVLKNGEVIKVKSLEIHKVTPLQLEELDKRNRYIAEIKLDPKYFGYFNSDKTSIISGYYKQGFKKSNPFYVDEEFLPWYIADNKELLMKVVIEDI